MFCVRSVIFYDVEMIKDFNNFFLNQDNLITEVLLIFSFLLYNLNVFYGRI